MGNEVGALTNLLTHTFGPEWSFPATVAAREASSCNLQNPIAPRTEKRQPVWPRTIHLYLHDPTRSLRPTARDQCLNAALALAGAIGLPVTLTSTTTIAEVDIVRDHARGRDAMTLGVRPRPGRKVLRRSTAPKAGPTAWTAASTPSVHRHLAPWWRLRSSTKGAKYLFPRFTKRNGEETIDESAPIGTRALSDALRTAAGDPSAQFHDTRRGVENALELVHFQVAGAPPVPTDVKNTIGLRSNKSLRGSRDSYIRDVIEPLFDATAHLHEVVGATRGGLLRKDAASDDAPYATDCQRCGKHLPEDATGAVCDEAGCTWTLCTKCFPTNDELLCPDHAPVPALAPPRQRADDTGPDDSDSGEDDDA
jgi:hypothetical protein